MYYQDATGYPVAGFMRCTRLVRREGWAQKDLDNDCSDSVSDDTAAKPQKRAKNNNGNHDEEYSSSSTSSGHISKDHNDFDGNDIKKPFDDVVLEEFVCVIRPASSSSPQSLNNLHLLSAASMVAHDSRQRSPAGEERQGSGSPSDGSNSSGAPNSSVSTQQTKNSTSSEDRSEDNSNGSDDVSNDH